MKTIFNFIVQFIKDKEINKTKEQIAFWDATEQRYIQFIKGDHFSTDEDKLVIASQEKARLLQRLENLTKKGNA